MTPVEVKKRVQDAYRAAMADSSMSSFRPPGLEHLFRNVALYGKESALDFVDTNIAQIIDELVEAAGCRQSSLTLPLHGFGRAAVRGIGQSLEEETALRVEIVAAGVRISWAEDSPRLV